MLFHILCLFTINHIILYSTPNAVSSFSLFPASLPYYSSSVYNMFIFYQDLIERLDSELSGDFLETVMALFVPPAHYDAWCIKEAIYVSF